MHGDLWANNLLWSTNPQTGAHHHRGRAGRGAHHHNNPQIDEDGNPSISLPSAHLKGIVDFQTMAWAHPLSDVLVLIFSSFSSARRSTFITDCLAHYRSHFKRSSGGQLYSDTRIFDAHVQDLIPHTLSWLIASWTIFKEEPEDEVNNSASTEAKETLNLSKTKVHYLIKPNVDGKLIQLGKGPSTKYKFAG